MTLQEKMERLQRQLPQTAVERDVPMSSCTTFRIGGPARYMAHPATVEDMASLLTAAQEAEIPWLVVGNGSNLLVRDQGVDALVIRTDRLDGIVRQGETCLTAQAGVSLARLASGAQKLGLTGLEFAHGIPGSVGGGVMMNAGAYGGEMCQVVREVRAWFPGEGVQTLPLEALHMSYRHSLFTERTGVVLEATVALQPGEPETIRARMEELMARRREKQPLNLPSAGSTFKRPESGFAAALIDQCGLKGTRVGGAQVSEKHAGFVVNAGGATCRDVEKLMALVSDTVWEKTGVRLEPEVRLVP